MRYVLLILLILLTPLYVLGQQHQWVDSESPLFNKATLTYSPNRATEGATALKVSGAIKQLDQNTLLDNNSLEITLANPLKQPEDWSIYSFVTVDIYMEENPSGLSEAKLTLTNSKGTTSSTSLILGWQLFQWENHQMTFPLKPNAYRYGNLDPEVLKDVVNVSIAFNRYSDEAKSNPYATINFHIDNMKLDGYILWDNFEDPKNNKQKNTKDLNSTVHEYVANGSNITIGLSKQNGAIKYLKDNSTGKIISQGTINDNLWKITFVNENELPKLESQFFDTNNKTYTFYFDEKRGILTYIYKTKNNKTLTLNIAITAISKNEIELKANINNTTNYNIRKVIIAEKLSVNTFDLKEALWPVQEGMILLPAFFKDKRSSKIARPPMFADVIAFKTKEHYLGIYLVQDAQFHKELIPYHPKDTPVFQPSNLCIGGELDKSYMYFEMITYISKGEQWTSPSLRITINKDFQDLAKLYRDSNKFNNSNKYPSLETKVGKNNYQRFKESPIYSVEMYKMVLWLKSKKGESWQTLQNDWLPKLKNKGILHLTHWQYGRDQYKYDFQNHKLEDDHPDALPIWWERYGSEKNLKALLAKGNAQGFTFMPFTNWTVWNKLDPLTNQIPTLTESPMATRKIRGANYPYYEYRGYMIEPWDDEVRQTNDRMFQAYTYTYPHDYMFVDMTGERSCRYILSESGKPTVAAYTQAVINENLRLSKQKPIFTEGVFDRIANSTTGYCQTLKQKFWNNILNHLGDEYVHWAPYPFAASVVHDKVAFYQHNLNHEVWAAKSNALMSYYVLYGYNFLIDLTTHINEDEEVINKLGSIQKLINSRICGEKLDNIAYLSQDKSVAKTSWGSDNQMHVIGNFDYANKKLPYAVKGTDISPNGFYAFDSANTIEGGVFTNKYNEYVLNTGNHTFILEKLKGKIKIHYLEGPGTDLHISVPKGSNKENLSIELTCFNKTTQNISYTMINATTVKCSVLTK